MTHSTVFVGTTNDFFVRCRWCEHYSLFRMTPPFIIIDPAFSFALAVRLKCALARITSFDWRFAWCHPALSGQRLTVISLILRFFTSKPFDSPFNHRLVCVCCVFRYGRATRSYHIIIRKCSILSLLESRTFHYVSTIPEWLGLSTKWWQAAQLHFFSAK